MDIERRLMEEVVARRVASDRQALEARQRKKDLGGSLISHLVNVGCAAPQVLEAARRVTAIPAAPYELMREAELPEGYAQLGGLLWQLGAAPLGQPGGRLRLAFYDPTVAMTANVMGLPPHEAYLALESDVRAALARVVGPEPARDTAFAEPAAVAPRAARPPAPAPFADSSSRPRPASVPVRDTGPVANLETEIVSLTEQNNRRPASETGSGLGPSSLKDRYEIGKSVGKGGMATVFLARDKKTGFDVALKIMKEELADDDVFVERFAREVRACADIDHQNLLKVHDFGCDDKRYFMSTEYVDGGSILELLRRMGRLPAVLAARLIDDVLAGLGAAHARGVVHRDLKPANLLLSKRDGRVKIADFGIAKTEGDQTLTQTGMLIGTPAYMAPEQVNAGTCDHRTDIWSTGVVLYELLTGRAPFLEDNAPATLLKVAAGRCVPIFEMMPGVPAVLEAALDMMLIARPEERVQSVQEVREVLAPLLTVGKATGSALIRESVENPEAARAALLREQAEIEVSRAEGQMVVPETRAAAAISLYRATTVDPTYDRARELLAQLTMTEPWQFGAARATALVDLLPQLETDPGNAGILKRAADLYRGEGNLYRSACMLKRYLKIRPTDSHARMQLQALVGGGEQTDPLSPGDTSHLTLARQPNQRTPQTIHGLQGQAWRPPQAQGPAQAPARRLGFDVVATGDGESFSSGAVAEGFFAAYGMRLLWLGVAIAFVLVCFRSLSWCIDQSRMDMDRDIKKMQGDMDSQMNSRFIKQQKDLREKWNKKKGKVFTDPETP